MKLIGKRTGTELRKDHPDIDCYYLTIKGSIHVLAMDHLDDLLELIEEIKEQ